MTLRLLLAALLALGSAARAEDAAGGAVLRTIEATPSPHRPGCAPAAGREAGLRLEGDRVTGAALFGEMAGFAAVAETTGGLNRRLFSVTSAAERDPKDGAPPPGSLRAAVEAARREGGGWILFDASAFDGPVAIDLTGPLRLPSNVTLDAGCADVTLTVPTRDTILAINPPNVIVTGFALRKRGAPVNEEAGDCITVGNTFDRVYIAHNDFGSCTDGQIDVTAVRKANGGRITIAFNRFSEHDKAMIVGTFECYPPTASEPCGDVLADPASWKPEIFATVFGNVFLRTGQRHPRVAGRAFAHVVNNVVAYTYYGVFVGGGGRALVESDVFVNASKEQARGRFAVWTVETPGAPQALKVEFAGAARMRDVVALDSSTTPDRRPGAIEAPPYRLDSVLDVAGLGAAKAAACVAARAGRFGATAWPAGCR